MNITASFPDLLPKAGRGMAAAVTVILPPPLFQFPAPRIRNDRRGQCIDTGPVLHLNRSYAGNEPGMGAFADVQKVFAEFANG